MVVSIAAILDACSIYLMTFFQRESPITNDVHVLLYLLSLRLFPMCWNAKGLHNLLAERYVLDF